MIGVDKVKSILADNGYDMELTAENIKVLINFLYMIGKLNNKMLENNEL